MGAAPRQLSAALLRMRKHYEGWLGWIEGEGALCYASAPEDRITRDRVEAYARALMGHVAPVTVSSYLRDLKVLALVKAPERDWLWLKKIANRVKCWARPTRAPRGITLSSAGNFRTCLSELERLGEAGPGECKTQRDCRDVLMTAILTAVPIRLKNLAMMEYGVHLVAVEGQWHVRFGAHETKNRQPLGYIC